MPLFESQKSRTRRLFHEAATELLQTMLRVAPDPAGFMTHSSWVIGGSVVAAVAATYVDPLKRLWGKGDQPMATKLIEVFTGRGRSKATSPQGRRNKHIEPLREPLRTTLGRFHEDGSSVQLRAGLD